MIINYSSLKWSRGFQGLSLSQQLKTAIHKTRRTGEIQYGFLVCFYKISI